MKGEESNEALKHANRNNPTQRITSQPLSTRSPNLYSSASLDVCALEDPVPVMLHWVEVYPV